MITEPVKERAFALDGKVRKRKAEGRRLTTPVFYFIFSRRTKKSIRKHGRRYHHCSSPHRVAALLRRGLRRRRPAPHACGGARCVFRDRAGGALLRPRSQRPKRRRRVRAFRLGRELLGRLRRPGRGLRLGRPGGQPRGAAHRRTGVPGRSGARGKGKGTRERERRERIERATTTMQF